MKNNLQQSNSLRFRRWSRRAWAVFASLGREVTIGALRVRVSEQSLVKSDGVIAICLTERDTIEEEDEELLEICLPELECVALRPVKVPAGSPEDINCFIKKRLERMYSFQPLLFLRIYKMKRACNYFTSTMMVMEVCEFHTTVKQQISSV